MSIAEAIVSSDFKEHCINKEWEKYHSQEFFDELISSGGNPRIKAKAVVRLFKNMSESEMNARKKAAELAIRDMGVSFTVYSSERNIDRAWPYDIIPRIISAFEWEKISLGLKQRLKALNSFVDDVYNQQLILKEGIVPESLVIKSPNYKQECKGTSPPYGAWANICGTDLVRHSNGKFFVLEDNLRVPSGISYMLENREVTRRVLPEIFENYSILPVDDYPAQLFKTLSSLSPRQIKKPCIALLTPGIFNSAYFEHAFLARSMGIQLVEGSDLFVSKNNILYMKTVDGPVRVDVVYRRIDEEFMDPEIFRSDSTLGVPGIMRAWKSGNLSIANAPGSGVADDKAIYRYVPEMIKFYLNESPIISNVKTYLCSDSRELDYVLSNIEKLVIKPVNESGGYGLLVGPKASSKEIVRFRKLITDNPSNYIAQPTLSLSTAPTYLNGSIEPRHLDLRPFILSGSDLWVTPGGLTRVALKKGSLVVNSSQGGGSKDTWIVENIK